MNIPKVFWKYYDLYRRKQITFNEYIALSGIQEELLAEYLNYITTDEE